MATIPGGAFNDFIFGTSAADFIDAGAGNDNVVGRERRRRCLRGARR